MKKLVSIILTVSMLFLSTVLVFAINESSSTLLPQESEWASEYVTKAKNAGITEKNKPYNYLKSITREEFCELIYNYYSIVKNGEISENIENKFTDTDNSHIAFLSSLDIIKGKSETEFAPNDLLTREESATIIFRLINTVHPDWAAHELWFEFSDNDEISDWAMNDIQRICNMGLMKGVGNGKFDPKGKLTTEQAIAILVRMYDGFNGNYANAENMTYADIENLQNSVDNGHFPWRLDYKQVVEAYLSGKGENVENGEFVSFESDGERCSGDFKIGDNVYRFELFKPIEKAKNGIWIVKTCEKITENAENKIDFSELDFADKLNAQMPKNENYMFSPLSIKTALALSANGATGETKTEILNALGIESIDDFNAFSRDLIKRYSQTDKLSLNIANSIWMNKDKTTQNFSKSFKSVATDFYSADVKTVNNKNAVKEINSWVSDKTNGKISEIVQNSDDFWSLLVNAIYFKGAWEDEFKAGMTEKDEFTNADGTKSQTDFMNKNAWINYAETKSVKIVELPYKNRVDEFDSDGEYIDSKVYKDLDVSMYVISADNDINVSKELEALIKDENFKNTYIKLSLPKFKFEYCQTLDDILKNTGIKTAFDTKKSDFTEMFDSGNMWFTNVIHKTYISVDEKGTEAAAVTAVSYGGSSLPPEPVEIKFNKPFYFAIRDNTSGEILFMGRYACVE